MACDIPAAEPAAAAAAAELESSPINSEGLNDAAIMFQVLSGAVPCVCSATDSVFRPAV